MERLFLFGKFKEKLAGHPRKTIDLVVLNLEVIEHAVF
jgi:hypothetical protein